MESRSKLVRVLQPELLLSKGQLRSCVRLKSIGWMDGQKSARTSTWNQRVKNGVRLGAGRDRFESRLHQGVCNWLQGWRALPSGVDRVISRAEILRTGRWLNPKGWAREIMEKFRATPHLQRRLMQVMTNSFPYGAPLHRMGLRRSNECTLCQRAWRQREDDEHEGCGRSDPETLDHIQSARCVLQARVATSAHHHCWQQVQWEIAATSPESKGWTFLTLEGEQSMQTFWKKTCR